MITCDICPWCKDPYPDQVDSDGYHINICGMSGNIVYTIPHKTKRIFGGGFIHFGVSGCGLYETVDDVLSKMTEAERKEYERKYPHVGECLSEVSNENQ